MLVKTKTHGTSWLSICTTRGCRSNRAKAKGLVAPNSGKTIVGGDWPAALRYKYTQPIERGECRIKKQNVNCIESICEISPGKNKILRFSN